MAAIVDLTQDFEETEEVQPQSSYVTKEELKTSTLYNKDNGLDRIIQNIKGNRWCVDYFLQLRDINDSLAALDHRIPISMQKYHKIEKLELFMQSPITQEALTNITGEAIINAGFTPNSKDMFKATLTGGREALFVIDNVNKRTYNIHETYVVDFKLFCILDGNDESEAYWNNLKDKVMKTYVYDKNHLLDFSAPVILQADYKKKVELRTALPPMIDYYFRTFINYDKNVIALPTTASIYTDLYLNRFIESILDQTDHELMSRLSNLSFPIGEQDKIYTIWDAILNRDTNLFKVVKPNLDFRLTVNNISNYVVRNMNYLGIDFIVREIDDDFDPTIPYKDIAGKRDDDYQDPINNDYRKGYYAVSGCVYNLDEVNAGYLEKLLIKYLKQEIFDAKELDKPLLEYMSWSTRDQFYLIPILIVLVKDAINHTFKSI